MKPSGKTKGIYDAGASLKLNVESLEAFASAIEDIFVHQDYIASRLGSLANYNIRKTLSLARRVITSAALNIEDLLIQYVAGRQEPLSTEKFMQALLLGDYNFYKRGDTHYVFPIFDVSAEVAQSPLIYVRILALLKAIHDARSSDDSRYISVASVSQYFDGMGYTETAVENSVFALLDASLVEPHDPSIGGLALTQRVALTYSGLAHLEMALFNPTFFEQMALTSLISDAEVARQIRADYASADQISFRLRKVIAVSSVRRAQGNEPDRVKMVDAVVVKMFADRGYGFVYVPSIGKDAFFHVSILPEAERSTVYVGKKFRAEINADPKGRGLQIRRVA